MLNTNSEGLREEIMQVIRAFDCVDEDFTHYFSCSGNKFFNSVEYNGTFYDFEEEFKAENDFAGEKHKSTLGRSYGYTSH